MNPKLLTVLIAGGLVVFCLAFFRTGSTDIKGLERPEIKLNAFAGTGGPTAKRTVSERSTESKFKKNPAERKKRTARSRRANRDRDKDRDIEQRRNTTSSGAAASIRADSDRDLDKNISRRASGMKRRDTDQKSRTKQEYLRDRAKSRRERRERIEADRIDQRRTVRGLDNAGPEIFDEEFEEEIALPEAENGDDSELEEALFEEEQVE